MAEKTEVDMDLFSRRISPYFTWLESRIESGWRQNESVNKDVLKATRTLATAMRAKFILGVSDDELKAELEKTMELFELALDAFPDYSGEVESKIEHFTKGIRTELGDQFIVHNGVKQEPLKVKRVKKVVPEVKAEAKVKKPKAQKVEVSEPKVKKAVKKKTVKKKTVKKDVVKEVVKEQEVEVKPEPPVEETKVEKPEEPKKPKKPFFLVRVIKEFIYGED